MAPLPWLPGWRLVAPGVGTARGVRFVPEACALPNEVVLPGAGDWNLIAVEEAHARGEQTSNYLSAAGSLFSHVEDA